MAEVVTAADGRVWRVYRRWLPWTPRLRRGRIRVAEAFDSDDVGDNPGILATIVGGLIALVVLAVVVPLLLAVAEVLALVVLLPLFVLARVLLRRPWIVVAKSRGAYPEIMTRAVPGWKASGAAVQAMAREIAGSTAAAAGVKRLAR